MAEDVCPKTISGRHDWEDRYGYRVCHYCSEVDQYLDSAKADIEELESQVDILRQDRRDAVAQLSTLRARLAEREAWIQEAMQVLDDWRCLSDYGMCIHEELLQSLRERAR